MKKLLNRALYFPLLAYFTGGMVVANLICLAVAALRPPGEPREARCRRIIGAMTAHFLRLCRRFCGFCVENRAAEKFTGLRGAVIVANHPSLIDAPALFATDRNLVCFYKAALRRSMLGLPCARFSGFIPNDSGLGGLFEAAKQLDRGRNVLIFPESSRSSDFAAPDAFGRSAALLAVRANAPVVCLAYRYEGPFLSKRSRMFRAPPLPLRLVIEHAGTLHPRDFPDAAALNAASRELIRRSLQA